MLCGLWEVLVYSMYSSLQEHRKAYLANILNLSMISHELASYTRSTFRLLCPTKEEDLNILWQLASVKKYFHNDLAAQDTSHCRCKGKSYNQYGIHINYLNISDETSLYTSSKGQLLSTWAYSIFLSQAVFSLSLPTASLH